MTQAQEPDPQLFGTTLPDVSSTRPINGLGDRQRSWSPVDDVDAWNVLGSTITPDPSLPSASNSFATEVGTSFASSSRGYNRPRTTRAERPTITRSGAVPDPPEAHRGPWWTQHGTLASGADHTVHEIGEEPEEYFDARMNRPLLSNEESATARGINLDRRLSSFGRQQNLMRGNQEAVGSEQHPSRPTEAAGLRQTEMDYCPHDTVREVEDGNAPTTGERDDDSSSTTSSDSLDSYDEGTSGRNYRPEVVNQLDMELVRECDGFLEGLRQLISSNNRLTGDVHGIREGLRGLRRMVDTAAARTPHGGDAAASNGEMSGAVA